MNKSASQSSTRPKEAYQVWLDLDREMMNEAYKFVRELGVEDLFGEGAATPIMNILGDVLMNEFGKLKPKDPLV